MFDRWFEASWDGFLKSEGGRTRCAACSLRRRPCESAFLHLGLSVSLDVG